MKNLFLLLIAALLVPVFAVQPVLAADSVYLYDSVVPSTGSYTVISALTTTTTGTTYTKCFYKISSGREAAVSKHGFTATWGGATPTNIAFDLLCSTDGVSFWTCGTETMTSSPWGTSIDIPGLFCVGANYVSKSGGDATTSFTIKGRSGGL